MARLHPGSIHAFLGAFVDSVMKRSDTKKDNDMSDRLDCINRNISHFLLDVREIVHEELTNVIEESVFKVFREIRKPKPHIEVGYR
jgi:hypothetical protein